MMDREDQASNDVLLWELDMERSYEDSAFFLDELNLELQATGQQEIDQQVELMYDDYLAALFRAIRG
jgi:hypothetical protein